MSCNFQVINGKLEVLNDQGLPSKLYKEAVEKFGEETAKDIFLVSKSDDFIEIYGKPQGRLLNNKQSEELRKEIKAQYTNQPSFISKKQDIRENLYNYDNPLAEKNSNGVNLRITQGLIRNKKKTYLLYADGRLSGEFYSVDEAKAVIKYIEDNLIEPKLSTVLNYIAEQNQTKEFATTEQIIDLQNVALGISNFNVSNFTKAFYDENGIFYINPSKLKEFYSDYEIQNLQNNIELQKQVKESVERLKIIPNLEVSQDSFENLEKTQEVNSFGKLNNVNPFIVSKTIVDKLGGTTQEEFDNNFSELEYPNLVKNTNREQLYKDMQEYKKADSYIEVDGELQQEKNSNTEIILPLVVKQSTKLEDLNSVLSKDLDVLQSSPQATKIMLKTIEDNGISEGIDLIGLSEKEVDGRLMEFLRSLNTFMIEPTKENTKSFSDNYNEYFEKNTDNKVIKVKKQETDRNFVTLNTKLSEIEVYDQQGLIKVGDNLYVKVNKKTAEELYPLLYTYTEKFPSTIKNLEEFKTFIQSKVSPTSTEEIELFKMYFDATNEVINDATNEAVNFSGDSQYLTGEYVSDFYIEGLKEKAKNSVKWRNFYSNFSVNEKGIYLINDDSLTLDNIKLYADENLKQYSLLSTQMPNLIQETILETKNTRRDNAINNPNSIKEAKGQVYRITDNEAILKNSEQEFVKIQGNIYESVDTDGNLSLFVKLEKNNAEYNRFNNEAPQTEIKLQDYTYLDSNLEDFSKENKKDKKIIEEKFDCL